jgi:hypothetical protein
MRINDKGFHLFSISWGGVFIFNIFNYEHEVGEYGPAFLGIYIHRNYICINLFFREFVIYDSETK